MSAAEASPSTGTPSGHADEIRSGRRFEFGANWRSFLAGLDDGRIAEAERSLRWFLGRDSLAGIDLLDIGCGSGLFSLAARRLGARVTSFDFDPQSVACAQELRRRYFPEDADWRITEGSVLDATYLAGLGVFDVVYSWGVLHHTGDMWRAIDLAAGRVKPGGTLAIALYNDQGRASVWWRRIKRIHCALPACLRKPYVALVVCACEARWSLSRLLRLKNPLPFQGWSAYRSHRGMSAWHDWIDWVGGYPFEVARPDLVIMRLRPQGFIIDRMEHNAGWGNNQMAFTLRPELATATPQAR